MILNCCRRCNYQSSTKVSRMSRVTLRGLLIVVLSLTLVAFYHPTPLRPHTHKQPKPRHQILQHSAAAHTPASHANSNRRTNSTNVLASYVESRSAHGSTHGSTHDTNVTTAPFRQTNNHQPFSTQARAPSQATARPTAQPRVNLWNSSLCGVYV